MKKFFSVLAAVALTASCVVSASADEVKKPDNWPKNTINIVVGYTAGGDSDLNARLVAKYLAKVMDVNVIVTNTEGSSGMVAAAEIADANPDGYMIYWGHGGVNVTQAYGGASVDMLKDFEISCGILTDNSYTLCVSARTGIKDYKEMKERLNATPKSLSIIANANSGNWYTVTNIEKAGGFEFKKMEGPGSAATRLVNILAGAQDLIYTNYNSLAPYIEKGELNVIGTIADQRSSARPNVPCLTELGCQVRSHYTFGFRFPKGTDRAILDYFEACVKKVSEDPEFKAEATKYGVDVTFMTGKQYADFSREVYDRAMASLAK